MYNFQSPRIVLITSSPLASLEVRHVFGGKNSKHLCKLKYHTISLSTGLILLSDRVFYTYYHLMASGPEEQNAKLMPVGPYVVLVVQC